MWFFDGDDDGTQDTFRDLEDTVKLCRHLGLGVTGHVDVVAFHQVVDRVRKTTLAPLINAGHFAVAFCKALEFFHESRDTLFTLRGIDDIEDLILCGKLCHDVAPPFGLMAAESLCGKDRLHYASWTIISAF